jgi:monoterpene epsilon-lactone hydrolase
MWTPLASRIALQARARVVLPDYSLAPERPFPAAVHDAMNLYLSLAQSSETIFAGGESAGGGLAAALALAIRRCDSPPLAGLALVSPWLDLTLEAQSYLANAARDTVFSKEAATRYADFYLQGHDSKDELASPLHCVPTGFPPTLLMVGTEEVLLDDSLEFARRLAGAGSSVELHVMVGMQHAWPIMQPGTDETAFAIERIADHIERARWRATPKITPITTPITVT